MRTIMCDRCGKQVQQAIQIRTDLILAYEHLSAKPWSDGKTKGDYCQECIADISEFVSGYRPTKEDLEE